MYNERTPDDSASRICRILQRDPRPRAVFIVGSSARTALADSTLSDTIVNSRNFVGVYDGRALEDDIADDISYVTQQSTHHRSITV